MLSHQIKIPFPKKGWGIYGVCSSCIVKPKVIAQIPKHAEVKEKESAGLCYVCIE